MAKTKIQIADSIPDRDLRLNAKHHEQRIMFTGKIDGKEYRRSSKWWGEVKTIIERVHFDEDYYASPSLVASRSALKWTEDEATGAYVGETRKGYHRRMSGKPALGKKITKQDKVNRMFELFNSKLIFNESIVISRH